MIFKAINVQHCSKARAFTNPNLSAVDPYMIFERRKDQYLSFVIVQLEMVCCEKHPIKTNVEQVVEEVKS